MSIIEKLGLCEESLIEQVLYYEQDYDRQDSAYETAQNLQEEFEFSCEDCESLALELEKILNSMSFGELVSAERRAGL